MQVAYVFQELFNQIAPLLLILFIIGLIWSILAPNSLKKKISMSFENPNINDELKEKKAINVCYGCGEKFEDADVFCGSCGYNLSG